MSEQFCRVSAILLRYYSVATNIILYCLPSSCLPPNYIIIILIHYGMESHPSVQETLKAVLAYLNTFIEHHKRLELLQDDGEPLSEKEQKELDTKREESKTKHSNKEDFLLQ